jgi:hypothetical protein
MIRDQGPIYNLGYGVNSRSLPRWEGSQEERGVNPESGAVSKLLSKNPAMKFIAASAATMLVAGVATSVTRKGGLKLFSKLEDVGKPWATQAITDIKTIRDQLDAFQGVTKTYEQGALQADQLFGRKILENGSTEIDSGTLTQTRSFFITREEGLEALRTGRTPPAAWHIGDEIQSRLVSAARRMPYELPAFYAAQKGLVDPLMGTNQEKKDKVNWFNPLDVVTDFVSESAKIAVVMMLPFEAGTAGAKQGWRRFMTYGDDMALKTGAQRNLKTGQLTMKAILGQVGADATDTFNKVLNFSSRTTGALSSGLNAANEGTKGLVQHLHSIRHNTPDWGQMSALEKAKGVATSSDLLDAVPGPFRGLKTGAKEAAKKYRELAASQQAYKDMLRLGADRFERDVSGQKLTSAHKTFLEKKFQSQFSNRGVEDVFQTQGDALRAELGKGVHGVESLARQWRQFGRGGPIIGGKANKGWKQSQFYRGQVQKEYSKILSGELQRLGVEEEAATKFVTDFRISRPKSKSTDDFIEHITQRIKVNGRGTDRLAAVDEDDFFNNIQDLLSKRVSEGSASSIRKNLKTAIEKSDATFLDKGVSQAIDRKLANQWDIVKKELLPKMAKGQLKSLPVEYGKFSGKLGPEELQFLQRKTAQLTGLQMTAEHGQPISHDIVLDHLKRAKLDPNNTAFMKGFLVDQGAISKPWNSGGRNVFGLKALTVDTALSKGIFRSGQYDESDVRSIVGRLAANDPVSNMGQYALRGAWESNTGAVLDTTILKRGFNKFLSKAATDYQIPLIKLNPLQMMGVGAKQELADKAIFQYIPSMSNQAFLRGKKPDDDFYLWMKSGHRGSKGKVFSIGTSNQGAIYNELPGTYRPYSAVNTIMQKHARYAIKDEGYAPMGSGPNSTAGRRWKRVKDAFDVSDHQQDSLFGYVRRFRDRATDVNNRQTFARLLEEGQVTGKKGTYTLDDLMNDPKALERATQGFFGDLGGVNIPGQALTGLADDALGPELEFIRGLKFDISGKNAKTLSGSTVSVTDLKTPEQFEEFGRIVLSKDAEFLASGAVKGESRGALKGASKKFLESHLDESYGGAYWDKMTSTGTRLDAYKRDLIKYLTVRESVVSQKDFNQQLPDILGRISKLRSTGAISASQATETKAALMSIQYDVMSMGKASAQLSRHENLVGSITQMRQLAQDPVSGVREILNDISSGRLGTRDGFFGKAQPWFNKRLRSSSYQYEGAVFNPFGSNTVLIPTFGTAFSKSQGGNPIKAVRSVLGSGTYKNQEAFSDLSVVTSHLVERLNRPLSTVGLGLDPTKYNGPLDMYVRGMVGKRALPLVAAGTTAVALDRTLGGYMNGKDQNGDRVYSPYVIGKTADAFVKGQAVAKGLVPGGEGYESHMKKMESGEVPIRAGRWWPLGNTPFKGGRVQYYRPNWYRRLKSGYMYTDQTYGSPMERLAYGYDYSPLRAVDPYRFERKHFYDRPYPETGEYFTGPWGPLTSALNMTVGKVLKPTRQMHQQEVREGLARYASVGDYGAYRSPTSQFAVAGVGSGSGFQYGDINVSQPFGASSSVVTAGGGGGYGGPPSATSMALRGSGGYGSGLVQGSNNKLARAGGYSLATGANQASKMVSDINARYKEAAYSPSYGTLKQPGLMDPRIIAGAPPISRGSLEFQTSQFGYELQEMSGIYGFTFGAVRKGLGLGDQNFSPDQPVLASAGKAYGSTRGFWDLNLGGVGDFPLPMDGNLSNFEFSEIARRFIPKERSDVQYINPIKNDMGLLYPWLPGSDYYQNFKEGDPYTVAPEGEMRLPGKGYERLHKLNSDNYGKYGLVDQLKILGDVAPWSQQYRQLNSMVGKMNLGGRQQEIVNTVHEQVAEKKKSHNFTPYEYKYGNNDPSNSAFKNFVGSQWEKVAHADTYLNTKFMPNRTASEDWERSNVYGATFPEWQNPVSDFLAPMVYKSTQRGAFAAASTLGFIGSIFGKTPQAKAVGAFVGGAVGLAAGSYGKAYEAVTGDQFIPLRRKKELALEEYTDILSYVRNMHLSATAKASGDMELASQFTKQAKQTMYGADIYQGNLSQVALAVPKRKREHFKAMLGAPPEERKKILATAGRLERRIYEAAWGMPVEERPDLEEYFQKRELPPPGWEGYNPNTSMEHTKIKIGQSLGIDMSEMGYYPQQLKEANLTNVSYPDFAKNNNRYGTAQRLRELMRAQNIHGDVIPIVTPFAGERIELQAGVH